MSRNLGKYTVMRARTVLISIHLGRGLAVCQTFSMEQYCAVISCLFIVIFYCHLLVFYCHLFLVYCHLLFVYCHLLFTVICCLFTVICLVVYQRLMLDHSC